MYRGKGGLGVLPQKIFGLNGVKSCNFFAMLKREGSTVLKQVSAVLCCFRKLIALVAIHYCKHLVFVIKLMITQMKLLTIC